MPNLKSRHFSNYSVSEIAPSYTRLQREFYPAFNHVEALNPLKDPLYTRASRGKWRAVPPNCRQR